MKKRVGNESRYKFNKHISSIRYKGVFFAVTILLVVGIVLVATTKFKVNSYDKKIIVGYKEKYDYKYPDVCYGNFVSCKKLKPSIRGEINTEVIGKYKIEFVYKYKNKKEVLKQEIVIKDLEGPRLEIDKESIKICPNGRINSIAINAFDNLDGNITDKVLTEFKDGVLHVEVMDSSDNKVEENITVDVKDEEGPIINVNGDKEVIVFIGANYDDAGATAVDNCDGEIQVDVSGGVDTNTIGEYEINYSARDAAGNSSIVSRKITVKEKPAEYDKNDTNTSGIIYLTFDDGPGIYTGQILDTLAKYNIKATFFVTMAGSDDTIKREFDEGHTIGLHTATHKYNIIYSSMDAYFEDLNAVSERVKNITGVESRFIRFPGGTSNQVSKIPMSELVGEVTARGYKYFDWNVSVEDAGACARSKDKQACIFKYFKTYLKPNKENIVLMHDIKSYTSESLEGMLQYAISKKYTFKQIDDTTEPIHYKPYK